MLARTATLAAIALVTSLAPEASARDRFGFYLGPNGFSGYYSTGGNTFALSTGYGYARPYYPAPRYYAPAPRYYAPAPVYVAPPCGGHGHHDAPVTVVNNYYAAPAPVPAYVEPSPYYAGSTYYR